MAMIFSSGYSFKIAPLLPGTVDLLTVSVRRQLLLGGVIGWAALFALRYFTSHTNMGRAIIAIPQSVSGSQVIGLDVVKIQMLVYFVGGAAARRRRVLLRRVHRGQRPHVGLPDDHHVHDHHAGRPRKHQGHHVRHAADRRPRSGSGDLHRPSNPGLRPSRRGGGDPDLPARRASPGSASDDRGEPRHGEGMHRDQRAVQVDCHAGGLDRDGVRPARASCRS